MNSKHGKLAIALKIIDEHTQILCLIAEEIY